MLTSEKTLIMYRRWCSGWNVGRLRENRVAPYARTFRVIGVTVPVARTFRVIGVTVPVARTFGVIGVTVPVSRTLGLARSVGGLREMRVAPYARTLCVAAVSSFVARPWLASL